MKKQSIEQSQMLRDLEIQLEASQQTRDQALHDLHAIQSSITWRITAPVRNFLMRHPRLKIFLIRMLKLIWWTVTLQLPKKIIERYSFAFIRPKKKSTSKMLGLHIVYIAGEPNTPGETYRIARYVEAAKAVGFFATHFNVNNITDHFDEVEKADVIIIWRAHWSDKIAGVVKIANKVGAKIIFDIDDLINEPKLAKIEIIDGIRSQNIDFEAVKHFFELMQQTYVNADFYTAPTTFLARRMGKNSKAAFVLPNGFEAETLQYSRNVMRRWRQHMDGLVRIGYAAGTKTHQRDFAQIASVLADVLKEHPECRLVLFQDHHSQVLKVSEFPELQPVLDQIEWRHHVPLSELPAELARFDINLAPLEADNVFCNAKSELKYFEAALVNVPTIASPTEPYREAIENGVTGFLANTPKEWYNALTSLINDRELRQRIARAAYHDVLWKYGPERRIELMKLLIEQICYDGWRAAQAFELSITKKLRNKFSLPLIPEYEILLEIDTLKSSQVSIIIPLYNYGHYLIETLESVKAQTLPDLDLILVDDASPDNSAEIAKDWIEKNAARFNRIVLAKNLKNSRLALTRNTAFCLAETPFVLPLDSDNLLLPACAKLCLEAIEANHAAFAYPVIEKFGEVDYSIGTIKYQAMSLASGNYIDAMALIRKAAWAAVGGYHDMKLGWEDYDLWCKFAEVGLFGVQVTQTLARYRAHKASMLQTMTDLPKNKQEIVKDMTSRHPWLEINSKNEY